MTKRISIIVFFMFFSSTSWGQIDSVKLNGRYLRHYWTDSRDFVISPIQWKGKDWLKAGVFTGATILLMVADDPVHDFVLENQTPFLSDVTKYGLEPWGNYYSYATIGGFILAGEIFNLPLSRSTGYLTAESLIISGILVRIPKILLGRLRPDAWPSSTPLDFKGPFHGTSFPSGHTTAAFSVASVIAFQYRQVKWVPIAAYSLAGLVGLSRIYDNRHWASDVFAGALLGTLTGRFICRQYQQEQLSFYPVSLNGIPGLKMVYSW